MTSLETIFGNIKPILEKHSSTLIVTDAFLDSKAKTKKSAFHLYGNKEVSLFGKKPQNVT